MNRKILFKAKRIDWKSLPKKEWWVEGDVQHTISKNIVLIVEAHCDKVYLCDSSTLCQYTNITDKTKWEELSQSEKEKFLSSWNYTEDRQNKIKDWKGRKIWENDICDRKEKYPEIVTYNKGDWQLDYSYVFKKEIHHSAYNLGFYACERNCVEVIGNIFDKADLLEVEG